MIYRSPESGSPDPPATPAINFFSPADPSPIISPWGGRTTSAASLAASPASRTIPIQRISTATTPSPNNNNTVSIRRPVICTAADNVVLVECRSSSEAGTGRSEVDEDRTEGLGISANHPFIQRVHNQDSRSNLLASSRGETSSPCGDVSTLSSSNAMSLANNINNSSSNSNPRVTAGSEPYRRVLTLADTNLVHAESILSTLGCQRPGLPSEDDSEEDPPSLGSDIESNIRKLEKTQAKINAALETFRSAHKAAAAASQQQRATTLDNAELFATSLPAASPGGGGRNREEARHHRVTYPQSNAESRLQTSRCGDFNPAEPLPELKNNNGRKTSLFRRHSFNHVKDKAKAGGGGESSSELAGRDCSSSGVVWGGGESSDIDSARSSAIYEDAAFSDSEGSFSPLKNRIRGLLGSFGKGKKKLTKSPRGKKETPVIMREPGGDESDTATASLSIGQFTELVKSLPANSFSTKVPEVSSPAFLRPKNPKPHRAVGPNNSNDTYASSTSTNQSFNLGGSNRNSVISAASISSESYDNDGANSDENATTSTSSPPHQGPSSTAASSSMTTATAATTAADDLTPAQRQERKLFYIAREIMSSEAVYVDVLRLLNTEFREFVSKARAESKSGLLPDQGWKFMSRSHCQELCQQASWLLIGYLGGLNIRGGSTKS